MLRHSLDAGTVLVRLRKKGEMTPTYIPVIGTEPTGTSGWKQEGLEDSPSRR